MKRFFRRFRRLQWKLTLSYTLTTVLAMLLIEIISIVGIFIFVNLNLPWILSSYMQQEAVAAAPFFAHTGSPDREALAAWAGTLSISAFYQPDAFIIVDQQGRVLVATGNQKVAAGILIQSRLPTQATTDLQLALGSKDHTGGITYKSPDGHMVALAPVVDSQHIVRGALIMEIGPDIVSQQNTFWSGFYFLRIVVPSLVVFIIFAGIVGTVFGLLTARGFIRRFNKLSVAANQWSEGDFSVFVNDASHDEFGQLTRQLNHMAEELQNLLQTRQKLATLEERNRLARDLHDSVKQQIFAASMQLGATRGLLRQDVEKAQKHLGEAEYLVRQTQKELTTMIRELRSVALEGKGLSQALREFTNDWARQSGITVDLDISGELTLPPAIEDALFRITQEALANVARHSHATRVEVRLSAADQTMVALDIFDNGSGFDTEKVNGQGVGLLSIRERAGAFGGYASVQSTPGQGTNVSIALARSVPMLNKK